MSFLALFDAHGFFHLFFPSQSKFRYKFTIRLWPENNAAAGAEGQQLEQQASAVHTNERRKLLHSAHSFNINLLLLLRYFISGFRIRSFQHAAVHSPRAYTTRSDCACGLHRHRFPSSATAAASAMAEKKKTERERKNEKKIINAKRYKSECFPANERRRINLSITMVLLLAATGCATVCVMKMFTLFPIICFFFHPDFATLSLCVRRDVSFDRSSRNISSISNRNMTDNVSGHTRKITSTACSIQHTHTHTHTTIYTDNAHILDEKKYCCSWIIII